MKSILLVIFVSLFTLFLSAQDPEKIYQFHYNDVSFPEFSNSVLKTTGVRIYYKEKWVSNIRVIIHADSISVISAVRKIISGTNLEVSVWNNDLIIIPGEKLIADLQAYQQIDNQIDTTLGKKSQLTEIEERYLISRKAGVAQIITIGRRGSGSGTEKAAIMGRILDQENGEPLISVPVYIVETKTGSVSDINGFFTMALFPGKYNVLIEYLGYSKEKFILQVYSGGNLSLSLKKAAIYLQDVVIKGELQTGIRVKVPGLDQITPQAIKSVPMMMGERDILKVSVTLPGIISASEGGAGINVRGSGFDQNAFYINRIPIYNTSHLFGFFSAINSDIIKNISIYKGHIPAQYGGRLASVFNITTRQGNNKNVTAHGGISPVAGNVVVEGPLKKDTSSFLLSVRSSYSDWILSKIRDTIINASSANFYDISGGANWDVQKTQVLLFGYHSYDYFRLEELNNYKYANNGVSLIIGHTFSNSLRGELSLIGSGYDFSTIDKLQTSAAYQHSFNLKQYEARVNFRQLLGDNNTLEYGTDVNLLRLNRGNVTPFGGKSLINPLTLGHERGIESSLFLSDSYDIIQWLNIDVGTRFTLYVPLGPSTVYTYDPSLPNDLRYVNDTLQFGKGKALKFYKEPDLRITLNIKTDEEGSLKLAFNQMHQNLFMLNTTTTLAPNTQWKLSDYHIKPSAANQISFGVFRTLPKNGLEISVEVYYKKTSNYPEFKDGTDFLRNSLVETMVLQGDQKAYGLELYLKRSSRKLAGWISYTFSRSLIRVTGDHSWQKINNGEPFSANYDIPHSLNAVANYYFSRRVIFSTLLTYQMGKPITYPESVYYIDGTPILNYSKRNAYRIPDYFRTDFSLTVEGNLNAKKLIHSSFIFSLYNATGRLNPNSVFFNTENGRIRSYKYSIIGVPILTATWQFKFGNYAAD